MHSIIDSVAKIQAQVAANNKKESDKIEPERKGLEFMAIRFNIVDKRRELRSQLKPAENYLLDEIELATIGGRNEKRTIASEAQLYIEDLSNALGYKEKDKIWSLLKSLQNKKLIIRRPTRSKGLEIIGLNPEIFGQILIDKQDAIERRKHLKLVKPMNDSKNEHPIRRSETDESSVSIRRSIGHEPTDRRLDQTEELEIIEEKSALDSSRSLLDSSRGQNQENKPIGSGNGNGESWTDVKGNISSPTLGMTRDAFDDRKALLQSQLEALKAGKL